MPLLSTALWFWTFIFKLVSCCLFHDWKQLSLYIDLARAKSEAIDNTYSLLKQNIKSWNAKWRRTRERWKATIGLINKKATLYVQHTFCTFLLFCTTTMWNFQKRPGYTFYGGNFVGFLVHFFFHVAHEDASISHFLTASTKLHVVPQTNKKCLFCFFSLALALSLVRLRWPVALLSPFLYGLSISLLLQICRRDK